MPNFLMIDDIKTGSTSIHIYIRAYQKTAKSFCKPLTEQFTRVIRTALPPLDPALRKELTIFFREDILRTQELIGRDLSHWLSDHHDSDQD